MGVGGDGVADGEGVTVVVGVSRGGLMAWVLLVLVRGAACVWVVGGSGRATRGWCLAGLWSGGAGCLWCPVISLGWLWVCSGRCCGVSMLRVGGGVVVLPLLAVLVMVLVRAPPGELRVLAL